MVGIFRAVTLYTRLIRFMTASYTAVELCNQEMVLADFLGQLDRIDAWIWECV